MKPRLYIHIGTYKTGSTYIQNVLTKRRNELIQDGVYYPETDAAPAPNVRKHAYVTALARSVEGELEEEAKRILRRAQEKECSTVILSCEDFSLPKPRITNRMQVFSKYFDVRVISFLRRPDYFLESMWCEAAKLGRCDSIEALSKRYLEEGWVYYSAMLDRWGEFAEVTALPYQLASEGGVLASFSQATGVELEDLPRSTANVSPSVNCCALLVMMNTHASDFDKKRLYNAFAHDTAKFALGSRLRQEIQEAVSGDMAQLHSRYGLAFSNEVPEENENPLTFPSARELALAISDLTTGQAAED